MGSKCSPCDRAQQHPARGIAENSPACLGLEAGLLSVLILSVTTNTKDTKRFSQVLVGHHDDVTRWKHFPRYWPFMRGIHRSPVNSSHKGQWRGALMFSLICAWINGWVKNREAGDLRRYPAYNDVIVMCQYEWSWLINKRDSNHLHIMYFRLVYFETIVYKRALVSTVLDCITLAAAQ